MAKTPRTSPPDRDGDGNAGGSLKGNQTVAEAKGPAPEAEADAASAQQDTPWARDDARTQDQLLDIGFLDLQADALDRIPDAIASWTDEQVQAVDQFINANLPELPENTILDAHNKLYGGEPRYVIEAPDVLLDFLKGTDLADAAEPTEEQAAEEAEAEKEADNQAAAEEQAEAEATEPETAEAVEPEPVPTAEATPDQLRAGLDETIEGEPATETAPDTAVDLATGDDGQAPVVAVNAAHLETLVKARRLYALADGTYGADATSLQGIPPETVAAWVAAGYAEAEPSAGNWGGCRVTVEGRRVYEGQRAGPASI